MTRHPFKLIARTAALLCLAAVFQGSFAQSGPPPQSGVDIERSKQEAAAYSRGMQGGAQLDADGNVLLNSDGSVKTGPSSSQQTQNASTLMQNITGISGYQSTGNPAGRGGAAGAKAQMSGHIDFACGLSVGTIRTVAGQTFKFNGCRVEGDKVSEVGLQLCSKLINGGLCGAADFSEPAFYPADAYSTIGDVSVGIGCNHPIRSCRISVSGEFAVHSTGESLTQQATERQGGEELRQSLNSVVESSEYKAQVGVQTETRDCYAENQQTFLDNGVVKTCDGSQAVVVQGGPNSASCTPQRVCAAEVVNRIEYQKSCTRTFPVTSNQCTLNTKTRTCSVTRNISTGEETSSCTPQELAGATQISRVRVGRSCVDPDSLECEELRFTETYVFHDDYDYTDCAASPAPIDGVFGPQTCSMSSGEQELISCPADGWVGRTLSAQECTETGTDDDGNSFTHILDYRSKAGCGVCAQAARVGFTCRARPTSEDLVGSCALTDLTDCDTLLSAQVENSEAGITTSQRETYRCWKTSKSCSDWKTVNSCTNIDGAYGVDKMPVNEVADQGAFQQALTAGGVASALSQANVDGSDAPKIFAGEDLRCEKPSGSLAGAVTNDCCKVGLTKTGGGKLSNKCTDNEVKLASARRNQFVAPLGSYCSKKVGLFNKCVKRTETYCVFPGLLPRLVQEQGRAQLAEFANSGFGDALETRSLDFPYYSALGGWSSPVEVNGQQVSAYQQPAYCADPQQATQRLADNPEAKDCQSSLGLWFAVCSKEKGCGALPADPEGGSRDWQLTLVDPLKTTQTPLSRYALAKGACDTSTEQCAYQISAWPSGEQGRAVLSRDLSFEIYSSQPVGDTGQSVMLGDIVVRVAPAGGAAAPSALPSSLQAGVSFNAGSTWQDFALPTEIANSFTVPGTDISATGGCSAASGLCEYRFTGKLDLEAKPWGDAKHPDCSGFTLSQLSVLDFSQMDLSAWTASMQDKLPTDSALNAQATQQASQAEQQAPTGGVREAASPSSQFATISPQEDVGPFLATLKVPAVLPGLTGESVLSVQVDWGDGSIIERATQAYASGFAIAHQYNSPETTGMRDDNGMAGPGRGRTLEHHLVVTIEATGGNHVIRLTVRNVF